MNAFKSAQIRYVKKLFSYFTDTMQLFSILLGSNEIETALLPATALFVCFFPIYFLTSTMHHLRLVFGSRAPWCGRKEVLHGGFPPT